MNATDARDWKVDPTTGELMLDGGDIAVVSGIDAVRQALADALSLNLGEWFLDTSAGIPLFTAVLGKNRSLAIIGAVYRNAILAVEGVSSITSLTLATDSKARTLTVTYAVDTPFGIVTGSVAPSDLPIDMILDDVSFGVPLFE